MERILTVAILVSMAAGFISWLWRRSRIGASAAWPIVEGIVESGAMEPVANGQGVNIELPVFSFSYRVGSGYYGGRFALLPYNTDPGPTVVQRMIGRKLQIRVDPQKPETWFIADDLIEGCRVEQNLSRHLSHAKPLG
jgi:hypothetical protein